MLVKIKCKDKMYSTIFQEVNNLHEKVEKDVIRYYIK